jgi:hypothetical protein
VDLVVEMTWKKHGGTEGATEAMTEVVMEWCSKFQMTEERRGITADMIERGTILGIVSADALFHLCHTTDPGSGVATAEIDILGDVRAAADLDRVGGSHAVACMCLFSLLCMLKMICPY